MSELKICRDLGVTPAGLRALAKAVAHPNGWYPSGDGAGMSAQGARTRLERDGLIVATVTPIAGYRWGNYYRITDAGREIVARARAIGW